MENETLEAEYERNDRESEQRQDAREIMLWGKIRTSEQIANTIRCVRCDNCGVQTNGKGYWANCPACDVRYETSAEVERLKRAEIVRREYYSRPGNWHPDYPKAETATATK